MGMTRRFRFLTLLVVVAACAGTPKRNPLPAELFQSAQIPGMDGVREYAAGNESIWNEWSSMPAERMRERHPALADAEHHYLAISGGGANGAYGAGLLCGWTASGKRPDFVIVTGISTGALTAPFAFLGSDYDHVIKEVYTTLTTADLLQAKGLLAALSSDSIAKVDGLKAKIEQYVTEEVVDAIAAEGRRGRVLLLGTTNLDARKSMLWDITDIARTDRPERFELIRRIMLASASIPGAFPPVMFEVEANGQRYDEMHADGGTTTQVFLYPTAIDWPSVLKKLRVQGRPTAWVVRNSRLRPDYEPVDRKLLKIAAVSIDSLLRTQGIGDLYRIHDTCVRDDVAFRVTAIPDDFALVPKEPFDPAYMQQLFEVGFEAGKSGRAWSDRPPQSRTR